MRLRILFPLVSLICIVQVASYWLAASVASLNEGVAVPQPDTMLYCQAARRIVEGHPFSFSQGEAPTTGTTSVLYPFVLAVPYCFGAHGDSLLTAGFLLNALFYLVFVLSWGYVFCRWFRNRHVAILASVLLALSGQSAFCALSQSDTGMWMCFSSVFVAGLAMKKRWLWGSALILLPWIRPEGFVCLLSLLFVFVVTVCFCRDFKCRGLSFGDVAFLVAGVISALTLFAANKMIAGASQFSSVSGKGHFATMQFATAVAATVHDAVTIFSHFFLGLSTAVPRCFVVCPFIAGVCVVVGFAKGEWLVAARRGFLVCVVMAVLGIGLVASSGWQNTNCDRYLAWLLPVGFAFIAEGAWRISGWKWSVANCLGANVAVCVVPAMLVAFGLLSSIVFCMSYFHAAEESERVYSFAKECDSNMEADASIGVLGYPGVVYGMKERRVAHVFGIYSREFLSGGDVVNVYETLKHDIQCRFDYWVIKGDTGYPALGLTSYDDERVLLGQEVLIGPDTFALRKADWAMYDDSKRSSGKINVHGELIARVDVGYLKDEKKYSYSIEDRYNRRNKSFLAVSSLDGGSMFDGMRIVNGLDKMNVPAQSGKDLTIVMRTAASLGKKEIKMGQETSVSFNNPLRLNVAVNGNIVSECKLELSNQGFTDSIIRIPGSCITDTPCEIAFLGDHAVGCYWFYQ